jgi:hypothetical protein
VQAAEVDRSTAGTPAAAVPRLFPWSITADADRKDRDIGFPLAAARFFAAKRLELTPIRASRESAHSLLPPCSETGGNLPFHEMHIAISARISTPQCTRNAQVELIRPAATSYETFLQTFSIPNV